MTERTQMYEDSATGHKKMSHERKLNDKGRKVVQEKVGGAEGRRVKNEYF